MATIYEVSELAGVSLATVSRVINDSGVVSPKTRDKVIEAMSELGYRPNTIAQSLATKRSNSVGVLIPELYGPFFGVILSSIEDELRTESKHVIITAGHSDEAIEKDGIEFLSSRNCDALILHVYAVSDEYIEQLRESNIPIVVIGRSVPGMESNCISIDNEQGGYAATKTLIELGHRQIATITGPLWKNDGKRRFEGYRRALDEFGLEFNPALQAEGDYEEASGRRGMRQLLEQEIPFTALVCANDEMAAGAVAVAQQRGISIPDDLSVIGFDNVYFTTYMNPALSTVHYPIDDMGRMAARCVLRDVYGMNGKAIQNRFEPRVVRRASTKGH
jgi:LacI family transcriptional regulator